MSDRDVRRVEVLAEIESGQLGVSDASGILGLSERQVWRLLDRYRCDGGGGIVHRGRGRPSNHRLVAGLRALALELVRLHYHDFGPTLAAEKLAERHGLTVSRETLRHWMAEAGLWRTKAQRRQFHRPRLRRQCLGELVQIDGSEHRWFEDRGPPCTLLVFVDDATSRLMHLKFVPSESTLAYMQATRDYIAAYGRPVAFYSDRHGIFRVNRPGESKRSDGLTQFGRALQDLEITILCAHSPQAKGRVERAHLTLQDRLVKELRLAGISTMEAANRLLPDFVRDYNERFAKPPHQPENLHRPLAPYQDLDEVLAWREERTVTDNLTLHYNRVMLLLEPSRMARAARHRRVTVYDYPDGRLLVRWKGVDLPFRAFDKLQRVPQGEIVDNKRLSAALAWAQEEQAKASPRQRRTHSPTRRAQGPAPFTT
nr:MULTISPECIES: ISNCY family transposase [unclassified Azospirillum]